MEKKVYVIDTTEYTGGIQNTLDRFMDIAEEQGTVYSINGFTKAFNRGEINSNTDIIRII